MKFGIFNFLNIIRIIALPNKSCLISLTRIHNQIQNEYPSPLVESYGSDGQVRGSLVPWWVNVCRYNYKMHLVFHRGTIQLGRLPGHYLLNKFYKTMTPLLKNYKSDHIIWSICWYRSWTWVLESFFKLSRTGSIRQTKSIWTEAEIETQIQTRVRQSPIWEEQSRQTRPS